MVGLSPHSIVEKPEEKNKKNGDLKKIFFKCGTTDHLNSDSYQTARKHGDPNMKQTYEGRHTTSRKKFIDQKESLM